MLNKEIKMTTIMLSTLDSDGNLDFLYHLDEALDSIGEEDYQKMIPVVCFTIEQLQEVNDSDIAEYISTMILLH